MKIEDYQKFFIPAAKNRIIDIFLLEYGDIFDDTAKKLIKSRYQQTTLGKNVTFKASFTFTQFKWTGNSRKTNFRLSAHTLLNRMTANTSDVEDLSTMVNQLSLKNLSNFVKQSSMLNEGIGLATINNQISSLLSQSSDISSISELNISTKSLENQMTSFMSGTISLRDTISNLLKASTKTAITQKIYVSTSVDALQVCCALIT